MFHIHFGQLFGIGYVQILLFPKTDMNYVKFADIIIILCQEVNHKMMLRKSDQLKGTLFN